MWYLKIVKLRVFSQDFKQAVQDCKELRAPVRTGCVLFTGCTWLIFFINQLYLRGFMAGLQTGYY